MNLACNACVGRYQCKPGNAWLIVTTVATLGLPSGMLDDTWGRLSTSIPAVVAVAVVACKRFIIVVPPRRARTRPEMIKSALNGRAKVG